MTARTLQTPSYLLRRNIVLHLLRAQPPARLLEIGCGRGELLTHLARRGFHGAGLEISPEAAAVARTSLQPFAPRMHVVSDPQAVAGPFALVLALEVLEHIDDDEAALRQWRGWVADGGRLVLSVPAHMHRWTAADDYGGHLRRYEHDQLAALLTRTGFCIERFWSYGFPLTSVTSRLRQVAYRRRGRRVAGMSQQERTLRSSFDSTRSGPGAALAAAAAEALGRGFHWLQLPFVGTDLGESYLVSCRRVGGP